MMKQMQRILLLLFLLVFIKTKLGVSIQVIKTTQDFTSPRQRSGAKLRSLPHHSFEDLTICWRFRTYLRNDPTLLHLETLFSYNGTQGIEYSIFRSVDYKWSQDNYRQFMIVFDVLSVLDLNWKPWIWHHVCFTYERKTAKYKIVNNGQLVLNMVLMDFFEHQSHY